MAENTNAAPDMAAMIKTAVSEALTAIKGDRASVTSHGKAIENAATDHTEVIAIEAKDIGSGWHFARYCKALGHAFVTRQDPIEVAKRFAKADRRYGDIVKAMSATIGTDGGFMIPVPLYQDYIDLLRPFVVVRSSGATMLECPTGQMNLGRMDSGSTASYVGENVAPTASQPTTGQLTVSAKKLMVLVPVSNDLIRRGGAGAEALIRNEVVKRASVREDLAFIRGDGSSGTPKGIYAWTSSANKFNSTGTTVDTILADLAKAIYLLRTANVPFLRPGWILAPRSESKLLVMRDSAGGFLFQNEMLSKGTILGIPYKVTSQIPINIGGSNSELYLVDFSEVIIADTMQLQVEAINGGAYNDSSGTLVSGISSDQTVLKLVSEHDLLMQHSVSAVVIEALAW